MACLDRRSGVRCVLVFVAIGIAQLGCGSDSSPAGTLSRGHQPPAKSFGPTEPSGPRDTEANKPITIVLRDFELYGSSSASHLDFENPPYDIDQNGQPSPGYKGGWDDREIVTGTLGDDRKPVYKNPSGRTLTTHGAEAFAMWFNDVPGTNLRVEMPLVTTTLADGSTEYDSNKSGVLNDPTKPNDGRGFFPLDGAGFGNQGKLHNFSFTGEIHTDFTYEGGEYFSFRGDDDVWVYIDNELVIDLGGIHAAQSAAVTLDELGLTVGQVYSLDLFFAERHGSGSNLLFQTTLGLRPSAVR